MASDTQELEQLARALNGGWRIENNVMPIITIPLDQARQLADLKAAAQALVDNGAIAWQDSGHWHSCAICNAPLVVNDEDHEDDCALIALKRLL